MNWTKIKKLGPLGGNEYPDWTLILGQMMTTFVICGIVFYIIYITIKTTCIDRKVGRQTFTGFDMKSLFIIRIFLNFISAIFEFIPA